MPTEKEQTRLSDEREEEPTAVRPNQILDGKYRIEEPIAEGGMGRVWRARHVTLGSSVAVKFLLRSLSSSPSARRRFLAEAKLAANLKSRHAVRVFDFGITSGPAVPYLVMELLEGPTLQHEISRSAPLAPAFTIRILQQAARALDRAHGLGIVHRDFKPANIMLVAGEDGAEEVKVLDFGIAKLRGEMDAPGAVPDNTGLHETLSRSGSVLGTPYYMAPEQARNSIDVGPAADIWALGVVAYECLTGQRPFEAPSVPDVIERVLARKCLLPSGRRPGLPTAVDAWFERCCAIDPAARFPEAVRAVEALGLALGIPVEPPSLTMPAIRPATALPRVDTGELADTVPGQRTAPHTRVLSTAQFAAILAMIAVVGAAIVGVLAMR
jgi:serine/threonine-protein kinase